MTSSQAVERITAICQTFGVASLSAQVEACGELLCGGGVVDIVVVGKFKAGKSSFLNGLIGKMVLPVHVLPATAVVTRIGYGPEERAIVHRFSDEAINIPLTRLAEFVTERGNPANEKQVAVVDVELPALASYERIRFVDTPGLGSVFAHNTKASKEWMPRVGAALVTISVNHPLSEDDLLLLHEVSSHTPEAAILLTKADLVSSSDLGAIVEFTRQQVAERTGKDWPILPISDRPAFEEMRAAVRGYLRERIAGRREEAFEEIARHKVLGLIAGCREYLILAERAAAAAESARAGLVAGLARERSNIRSVTGEIRLFCHHLKTQVRSAANDRFQEYHREVTGQLKRSLGDAIPGWKGNLAQVTRDFEAWLAEAMVKEMGSVSLHGEGFLAGFLFRAQASVDRFVRAFQDRLAKEIERALGIQFAGARFDVHVEEPSHPDVRLSPTFDTHFELLWFLIPMVVFRPLVHRHFLRRIPWETEKNLSRVAGQWADAVGDVIDMLSREAAEFIDRELSTIEGLVGAPGRTGARAEEIRIAIEEIASLESSIPR